MARRPTELPLLRRLKPGLFVHEEIALNAEPSLDLLHEPLTPIDAFFIRNNGDLPEIGDVDEWRLTIDGEVERPLVLSLGELKAQFKIVDITAVLECAGNGRSLFSPATDGLQWRLGAVGCARWTGVRLGDVLAAAGVKPSAIYTAHLSPDRAIGKPDKPALSRGLPIEKALASETLVAFAMNGEPLPTLHGGPLRIVAPGFPGSAWQKWLDRVTLRDCEHDGEKMRGTDYRMPIAPVMPGEPLDLANFAVITGMRVKSLIHTPLPGFELAPGERLDVAGFAWSGSETVTAVTVSCDDGKSWREAQLREGDGPFAWRAFHATFGMPKSGPVAVLARAQDTAGNAQPLEIVWNPRGYCNNQVQRVTGVAR